MSLVSLLFYEVLLFRRLFLFLWECIGLFVNMLRVSVSVRVPVPVLRVSVSFCLLRVLLVVPEVDDVVFLVWRGLFSVRRRF